MVLRLSAASLALLAAAGAQAPPGFKTYENKLAPLTFHYPVAYKEVPLPPTEQLLVARFVLEDRPRELKKLDERVWKQALPRLEIFRFEEPGPKTGADGGGAGSNAPATVREAMEQQSRVESWPEFEKRLAAWRLVPDAGDPDAFRMEWKGQNGAGDTAIVGRLARRRDGATVFGVYGHTFAPHEKALEKIVERVAKSLALSDEDSGEMAAAKIDRLYATGKYGAVEWRKQIRQGLARGWRAVDTENYLIVHHSKNDGLIRRVARDVEAMRTFYATLFPPSGPIDKVAVVRICQTADEYRQYGGPPGTGGYFHPGNEELVLFDYSYTMRTLSEEQKEALDGRRLTSADSMLVLYHEAFHQYIHYAIGEFSPHDWFNEGYGDYFSGASVNENTGRVTRIEPSPWRIHLAKDMCEFGKGWVPLKEILEAERAVFYNRSRIANFYAGAWSFVYFLQNAKEVAANPKWSQLLQTYFDAVKQSYQDELKALGAEPDLAKKQVAGFKARKLALAKALDGVDLEQLEKVWRQWVVDMKDPWPGQRKKHK